MQYVVRTHYTRPYKRKHIHAQYVVRTIYVLVHVREASYMVLVPTMQYRILSKALTKKYSYYNLNSFGC